MPFGKHKGTPLTGIPLDYLQWLEGLDSLRPRLRFAVEDELQRRAGDQRPATPPSRLPVAVSAEVAHEIVEAGRRALAAKHHPDIGGSTTRMTQINATTDYLVRLVDRDCALASGR